MILPRGCAVVTLSSMTVSSPADNRLDTDMIIFLCGLLRHRYVCLFVLSPDECVYNNAEHIFARHVTGQVYTVVFCEIVLLSR